MSEIDDTHLAELLCARLCHDMAGPVGAAAAGAELAEESGEDLDPETLALVAASAAGAAARLKFFRAAFGPTGAAQDAAVLRDLADAYLRTAVSGGTPGIVLDWTSELRTVDGDTARLALNLVLMARDSLPRGGAIEVAVEAPGMVRVAARGEPAQLGEEARAVLVEDRDPAGPRGAHAMFTRRLAEAGGRGGLSVGQEGGALALSVRPSGR